VFSQKDREVSDINQVIRERKREFENLKRYLKAVDTEVEKIERMIEKILARKNKVPNSADYQRTIDLVVDCYIAWSDFVQQVENVVGYQEFTETLTRKAP
jgi:hypothetical protein